VPVRSDTGTSSHQACIQFSQEHPTVEILANLCDKASSKVIAGDKVGWLQNGMYIKLALFLIISHPNKTNKRLGQ